MSGRCPGKPGSGALTLPGTFLEEAHADQSSHDEYKPAYPATAGMATLASAALNG
jgi:hypothetical protein